MGVSEGRLISIVVPIYNEAETIDELCRRVRSALARIADYELVIVDDGSTDGSWHLLRSQVARDRRIRAARLSRNFGHQIAITAGLDLARGDAVVIMDGDLQHPPEVIPSLLEKWRDGYDVVYAVESEPGGEAWFKRSSASAFYRLLGMVAEVDIPTQAGDFRLLSHRAVEAIGAMPERARFLRGMAAWVGYRQIAVQYRGSPRYAGKTKYPMRRMLHLAADGITSFSAAPLRLVSALGILFVAFCVGYLLYVLCLYFLTDRTIQGWTTVVVLILLLGGIQLLSLGIVGQYVARVFDESKRRPLYLLDCIVESGSPSEIEELSEGRAGVQAGPAPYAPPNE
jgi:glycosyltransferase involved in cell wall biosynthesis